ncbi:MAG TPA: efflux RND transporter permease subunit, partial [Candidatus Deferrimicrobium sp.]|nr:efflux RND transporter permease subunit [Candidatus Deferrimicrobium sp.]
QKRIKESEIQTDMGNFWTPRDKYYSFKFNPEKLKIYNLQTGYITILIRAMLRESSSQLRLNYDEKEMSIEIKANDVEMIELDDILSRYYYTMEGVPFRLKDVVDVSFSTAKGGISRENQQYQSMVQWDYLGSAKSGDKFHKALFNRLEVPPGFKKSLETFSFKMTEAEEHQLNIAIIFSIFLIYMILVILYEDFFQPFLIMIAIPLALIGVFLGFVIAEFSFDSSAYIGIILLFGIVVSNSIILIENINRYAKSSKEIVYAIVIGTKERIRPVFMTSATTVIGMLPMVIFKEESSGGGADIWSSLALCTVGGLTTSAILVLVVLPIFYYYFRKFEHHIFHLKRNKTNTSNGGESAAVEEELS